jgi:hypothetical protein
MVGRGGVGASSEVKLLRLEPGTAGTGKEDEALEGDETKRASAPA